MLLGIGLFPIVYQAEVVVFDGSNGGDVALFDGSSLDAQSDPTSRRDDDFLVVTDPGILVPIESVEHVLGHGVFADKDAEGPAKGKKAKGIALGDDGIQDLIDKGPQEKGRVLDGKDHVPTIVLNDAGLDLILRDLNDVDDVPIIGQGQSFDLFFQESDNGRLEFGPKVDGLQDNLVLQGLDVKHIGVVVGWWSPPSSVGSEMCRSVGIVVLPCLPIGLFRWWVNGWVCRPRERKQGVNLNRSMVEGRKECIQHTHTHTRPFLSWGRSQYGVGRWGWVRRCKPIHARNPLVSWTVRTPLSWERDPARTNPVRILDFIGV